MKAWHRKVLIDSAKATIPFQPALRQFKRRVKPYAVDPTNTDGLIADGLAQIDMLREANVPIEGAEVLEFGSGWLPIIPLLFRLAGAKRVTLTDQEKLLDGSLIAQAIGIIVDQRGAIARRLGRGITEARIVEVLPKTGRTPNLMPTLAQCGLRYVVPFLPGRIADGSVDIVISRAVLEHVPPKLVDHFMEQFQRMLKRHGAMCHIIDMSDHWEHRDKSIGRINFLRYGDLVWKLTCLNPQNFQNRFRRLDYVRSIESAGFQIAMEKGDPDPQAMIDFDLMPLARRFKQLSREEAAILTYSAVCRPNGRNRKEELTATAFAPHA